MEISVIFNQMAVLFIALVVGYVANKLKVLTAESDRLLSSLIINIAMPSTILNSVLNSPLDVTGGETLFFSLMILLTFLLSLIIALLSARFLTKEKADFGLYAFVMCFGNVGSMGFAILPTFLGDSVSFFVALFNLPFTLIAFSIGIFMVAGKKGKLNLKVIINPPLVAAIIAIVIFFTDFKAHEIISGSVKLIGGMTTPGAMIVIGSTLAGIPLRGVFTEWRLYVATLFKLIVMPVIMWLILRNLISNYLMLSTLVILSAMPTANAASMLSMQYGGNEQLAAKSVFLTTMLSVATLPLIIFLMLS